MVNILFLPFILFEGFISSIARSLNLEPPPQFFSQLGASQGLPQLPQIQEFIRSASISNIEEETIERDERGFVVKRIVKRKVEES